MSDAPTGPGPEEAPKAGVWARYQGAATWVKVAIPAAIVAFVVLAGVLIANLGDDSTSTSSTTTVAGTGRPDPFLVLVAANLTTTTTTSSTTTAAPTTTAAATTTAAPTTAAPTTTAAAATTTAAAATTAAPTTAAPTTTTTAPTTTTTKAATTTAAPTTTAASTTSSSLPATTPLPNPSGKLADSPEAFTQAWNAAAGTTVPKITAWTQQQVNGQTVDVADLGGNIRLAIGSATPTAPVTRSLLAWLPLADPSTQAKQNQAYRDAFNVLMKTVNSAITSDQQASVSAALGVDSGHPPFATGASAQTTLKPNLYRLTALEVQGQTGPVTIIDVVVAP